jgi:hypothetical protein
VRWMDYPLCWVPMLLFRADYKDSHRSLVFKMFQTSDHQRGSRALIHQYTTPFLRGSI